MRYDLVIIHKIMFLIILFVLLFGWYIARGVNNNALSGLFNHTSEFEKQPIEMIAAVKEEIAPTEKTVHYVEYVALKRRKTREAQVQVISLSEMPEKEMELFLN